VVSTVRLGPTRFETAAFSPGWPRSGDAIEVKIAGTPPEAMTNHARAVARWRQPPPAGWFLRMGKAK